MAAPIPPIKGQVKLNHPPAKVYRALTDLDGMSQNIPDLVTSQKIDDRTLQCTVKPGFSFIRGTMKTTITLVETVPVERVLMNVAAAGIGMAMNVEARLKIIPDDGGSKSILDWEVEVTQRSGLLSLVSAGLIQGAAEKTVNDGWNKLQKRLESNV
jgi:carbon monoxide dehydrogenase subunit G